MNTPAIKAKTEKLIELQKALGYSDQVMADKIRVSRHTWRSAIEGKNVSAGFIAKVTVAFQVPFDQYFHTAAPDAAVA